LLTQRLYQPALKETHLGDSHFQPDMIHHGKREEVCHGIGYSASV